MSSFATWELDAIRRDARMTRARAAAMKRRAICMRADALDQRYRADRHQAWRQQESNLLELYQLRILDLRELSQALAATRPEISKTTPRPLQPVAQSLTAYPAETNGDTAAPLGWVQRPREAAA